LGIKNQELKNKKTYSHGYTIRKKERFSKEAYSFFAGEQLITVVTVVTPNIAK